VSKPCPETAAVGIRSIDNERIEAVNLTGIPAFIVQGWSERMLAQARDESQPTSSRDRHVNDRQPERTFEEGQGAFLVRPRPVMIRQLLDAPNI
jgi:hypothetical protein